MNKSKGIHQDRTKVQQLRPERKINRRDMFKLVLPSFEKDKDPFDKLRIDGSQCTGCGLCAQECPTEALTVSSSDETDSFQLHYRHDLCSACSQCIKVCPEQCLLPERTPGLRKIDPPAALLFKSKIARCRSCGNNIGSKAMINRLHVRLHAGCSSLSFQLELCTTCKIKQPVLGAATLEPTTRPD
jgi:ferredoxin